MLNTQNLRQSLLCCQVVVTLWWSFDYFKKAELRWCISATFQPVAINFAKNSATQHTHTHRLKFSIFIEGNKSDTFHNLVKQSSARQDFLLMFQKICQTLHAHPWHPLRPKRKRISAKIYPNFIPLYSISNHYYPIKISFTSQTATRYLAHCKFLQARVPGCFEL